MESVSVLFTPNKTVSVEKILRETRYSTEPRLPRFEALLTRLSHLSRVFVRARRCCRGDRDGILTTSLYLGALIIWLPGVAAGETPRWLGDVSVERVGSGWNAHLIFNSPLVQTSHSPEKEGRLVEVAVRPLSDASRAESAFPFEEQLWPQVENESPLRRITLEPQASGRALLVLDFSRPVEFSLHSAAGGLSLIVKLTEARDRSRSPKGDQSKIDPIMQEARRAMNAQDYGRAVALYSKVVSGDEGLERPDALEYLGLARLKNGQRAHARAEYQNYLSRYPQGDGALRVQQRLDALLSANQPDRKPLRASRESDPYTFDGYGTISTSYQRAESFVDLSGAVMLDSSQIIEFDGIGLVKDNRFDARARASGYLRFDYLDSSTAKGSRIRYLNLSLRDRFLQLSGVIGRQSGGGGGILGRFDGLNSEWSYGARSHVGAALGFPQESAISDSIDTSRIFFGARWGWEGWDDQLAGEVWIISQLDNGYVDRIAVGYEARWFGSQGSAFSAMDYDVYHKALNLIIASANYRVIDSTTLNFLVDYRRLPFIMTRNALIGQYGATLNSMRSQYSENQLKQIADDRTATNTTITIGVDQRLGSDWQIAGDLTTTKLSGTRAGNNVAATPETDWDIYLFTQLIANDVLLNGDTGRLSFRLADTFTYTSYELGASGRFPFLSRFWFSPRFNIVYRDQEVVGDQLGLRPGFRAEYRQTQFSVEGDFRLEWLYRTGSGVSVLSDNELGYLLDITVRWNF
jgi:hypothetical protein